MLQKPWVVVSASVERRKNPDNRLGEILRKGYEMIEDAIGRYIHKNTDKYEINGCLLCGSYVAGNYGPDSDIDILLLAENAEFDMVLEEFHGLMFDRMVACPVIIMEILKQESALSDVLSLSFGLANRVIIESGEIDDILELSTKNIVRRNLKYVKEANKAEKVIDRISYRIQKVDGIYHLFKHDVFIV